MSKSNFQAKIETIKQDKESIAESMLRTQFKMETMVYSQDRTYSNSLNDRKREESELEDKRLKKTPKNDRDNHATLQELILHLRSYYKVSSHWGLMFMNKYDECGLDRSVFSQHQFLSVQLFSYMSIIFQIASQRLADQIPLVIRYQMLQQSAVQLQREMLQMIQDKENFELLLKEDMDIGSKRAALQSRQKRLMKARSFLMKY